MAKRLSFEVLIRTALLGAIPPGKEKANQSELARRLGVSRRTVGRWLNDEAKPSPRTLERIEGTLRAEYKRVTAATRRINRHFKADPPPMAIPFAGERRMVRERDMYGKETGKEFASDWVNYDVGDYDIKAIFDLLRGLRERGSAIQIVYRVPKGGTSLGGREYKGGGRASTTPQEINPEWSDSELWERTIGPLHDHPGAKLRVLYIAVLEP